uniref:Uncharacterized protein n=1 Tax=Heliothis virescens TaxID=7102 RepID=A0A2A4IUQ3_HELVI
MRPNRRCIRPALQDVQEDSDDEAFYGSNMPVGCILFSSTEIYAAVQRISAMRPPCDCTEEVPIEPCLRPESPNSNMMHNQRPQIRSSTPVRSSADTAPSNADISINDQNIPEDINSNATPPRESLSDIELSPILVCKHKPGNKNITRRKLLTTPEPPLVRRRLSFSQRMPTPSAAGRLIANRIIKYARCIRNIHEKEMCCVSCGLLPTSPVTGHCGHTRCLKYV